LNQIQMPGRYQVEVKQGSARMQLVAGDFWADGTGELQYTPVNARPTFSYTLLGEVISGRNAGLVFNHSDVITFPADSWKQYDYQYLTLECTTQQFVTTSKSTDETVEKLAVSGKLGAEVERTASAALSKIANVAIKTGLTGSLGFDWVPGDTTKTFEDDRTMTVNYYDGGCIVKSII
jgi:hypothetical protein